MMLLKKHSIIKSGKHGTMLKILGKNKKER